MADRPMAELDMPPSLDDTSLSADLAYLEFLASHPNDTPATARQRAARYRGRYTNVKDDPVYAAALFHRAVLCDAYADLLERENAANLEAKNSN